jgi:hypothetical protein
MRSQRSRNSRTRDIFDENYLDKSLANKLARSSSSHYYLLGSAPDDKGRMKGFFTGPYPDMEYARGIAERKHFSSYEILDFGTASLATATQMLKHRRMVGDASMSDVLRRQAHKQKGDEI